MRELDLQAATALAIKIIAAATGYAFAIWLARLVGPADFGRVAFFLNAAALLSVIGSLGQQIAILRFVPPLLAGGDPGGLLPVFLARAFGRALAGAAILAAGAVGLAALGLIPGITLGIALAGFALIPVTGWADIQSHLCRACRLMALSLLPREVAWRAAAAGAIASLAASGAEVTARLILIVLAAALVLTTLVQGLILHRRTGLWPRRGNPAPMPAEWRDSQRPMWISAVSNVFLANVDVITVAVMFGPHQAGVYFAANRLAMLLSFPLTSQNIAIGPQLSRAWDRGRTDDVAAILFRSTRLCALATLVPGLVMLAFGAPMLGLFGPGFDEAAPLLRLLALAALLNAVTGPADVALNMCGRHRAAMRVAAASLVLAAVALPLGAILAGPQGVALAVLAATALRKAMYWAVLRHALGLRSDAFAPRRAGA